MFIQKHTLYVNRNINKRYLSNKPYDRKIKQVNLEKDNPKMVNKIPINNTFDYFIFLSFMSIWLGNFSRRKLSIIKNKLSNKNNKK